MSPVTSVDGRVVVGDVRAFYFFKLPSNKSCQWQLPVCCHFVGQAVFHDCTLQCTGVILEARNQKNINYLSCLTVFSLWKKQNDDRLHNLYLAQIHCHKGHHQDPWQIMEILADYVKILDPDVLLLFASYLLFPFCCPLTQRHGFAVTFYLFGHICPLG